MRAAVCVFWVGCATSGTGGWSPDGAMEAHRQRLDRNHDGVVDANEYEAVRWAGPPFATADSDGDGQLSNGELARLVRGQSATAFDGGGGGEMRQDGGSASAHAPTASAEVLVFLRDRVVAAGGAAPEPAAFARAVASGGLETADSQGVLAHLHHEWTLQGWAWPERGLPGGNLTPASAQPSLPEQAPSPGGPPPR